MASRRTQVLKAYDHGAALSDHGTSDSDDIELKSRRPKFLARTRRSRSSSPCSSSPSTPGGVDNSSDSSPHASNAHSDSYWTSFSSPKGFKFSKSFGGRWGFRRSTRPAARKERRARPMLLEQLPSDDEEKADYMTVVVGERSGKRESYVINKHLLTHHLFQTLLKCSEDMIGSPTELRSGALIFCDPALFLHLVEVVGVDLASDHSSATSA